MAYNTKSERPRYRTIALYELIKWNDALRNPRRLFEIFAGYFAGDICHTGMPSAQLVDKVKGFKAQTI